MLTDFISQIEALFPRALEPEETVRAQALVERAYDLIDLEFMRRGRSLEAELLSRRDVEISVGQAILEMVSRAILVGDSEGQASVSSTTGQESDSVTWSQGIGIRWGGVGVDDSIRRLLGLFAGGLPRGGGGRVVPYGLDRPRFLGAEFSG
ncbi:Gp19/Gp15/Gp42 family protein [Corynebacterium glutamicum]|uniref:Phage protein Gp19/Gp15/Gp42 n=2 Tax=Corynebacterium glutamicum TaxID=1718 RepID=Q5KRI9_CORGT|nr:Gp19/Gp15/Gp42 family protein [Corynebacterium glutamicum]BAD84092.1 hypothetical protein [Corynebacterium glutamicum]BAF54884.1 hypothetical protein cgR_1889 [Corynebacterium glutamicum R]